MLVRTCLAEVSLGAHKDLRDGSPTQHLNTHSIPPDHLAELLPPSTHPISFSSILSTLTRPSYTPSSLDP